MGSNQEEKVCTVLVTGFEPFQDEFPVNPSFEIARTLPQLLPATADFSLPIRVITHGSPVRVVYEHVREVIPPLLESYSGTIDMVLHIGMASCRAFYTVERFGHRDGYHRNADSDGKQLPEDDGQTRFADCPAKMTTSLDYDRVLENWRENVLASTDKTVPIERRDLRPSDDAGHYLCDYIYFNSLAWYGRRNKSMQDGAATDRPVLFLHVPGESDAATIEKGRGVAIGLIKAMAEAVMG